MMIPVRVLILTVLIVVATDSYGKLPGQLFLTARGGMSFPGIASEGSSFKGKNFAFSATYIPVPDSKIGAQISLGLESTAFRHYFDDRVFIEHLQKGISSDICAYMSASDRIRVLVGINVFLPFYSEADMGEKNFNATIFYSNDSIMSRYNSTPLQASAVIGFDYSLGKKGQSHFGLRVAQAGISPVQRDAHYNDANGNTIIISRKMKPMSVQIYLAVRIVPREKRKEKAVEAE